MSERGTVSVDDTFAIHDDKNRMNMVINVDPSGTLVAVPVYARTRSIAGDAFTTTREELTAIALGPNA